MVPVNVEESFQFERTFLFCCLREGLKRKSFFAPRKKDWSGKPDPCVSLGARPKNFPLY